MKKKGNYLATWEGLKAGTKFMVVRNSNSHNYPLNTPLTLKLVTNSPQGTNIATEVIHGNTIQASDCMLVPVASISLKDLKARKKELESEYAEETEILDRRIKFCEDNDLDTYDERIDKIFDVLTTLSSKKDNMHKAKVIAELMD